MRKLGLDNLSYKVTSFTITLHRRAFVYKNRLLDDALKRALI